MIFASFLHDLDAGRWNLWVCAVIGVGLAVLTLVGGRLMFFRAAPPPRQDPPQPEDPALDPFLFGSTGEKRSAARRRGGVVDILVSDEHAQAEPWPGTVVDRSVGGLCLLVKKHTHPGTVVTLRPVAAPPGVPWIEAKVRTCRETNEGWLLGCQFLRIPPTGLLLMFG
jgi:hypothetical protein